MNPEASLSEALLVAFLLGSIIIFALYCLVKFITAVIGYRLSKRVNNRVNWRKYLENPKRNGR